jgi:hypothetical protein
MIPIITVQDKISYDCGWKYHCFYYLDTYIGANEEEAKDALEKMLECEVKLDVEEILPW